MAGKREQAVMLVTQDKYQLPLAVAASSTELGRILGVSRVAIDSYIVHSYRNKQKLPKYIRVYLDDEEE